MQFDMFLREPITQTKNSSVARPSDELIVGSANTIYESGERNLQYPPFDIDEEIKVEK